jgi:aerobic carbon-monoxide dehydrogenase medium subunit
MKPPVFDYAAPDSVEEAVALLSARSGNAKIISGGQSLMPMLAFRLAAPELLVDLKRIQGLNRIDIGADGVRLGAKVRWVDIERSDALKKANPLLAEAVQHVAHYQIRNRGTVGGSLAHADPAAEMPGIAMACDAELTIVGPKGRRIEKAADFFKGSLTTSLEHDEVLTEVKLQPLGGRWTFLEFSRRRGDFALAGVALHYDLKGEAIANMHIGAIGVGDAPLRLHAVEQVLNGRKLDDAAIADAAKTAKEIVDPPSDIHAPADYRRALLATLLERALRRSAS